MTTGRPASGPVPVLVAGGGPVGMVLALELAQHGIDSVVVEQYPSTTTFPKMDLTNARSMELLGRWGPLDDIRDAGVGPHYSFDVAFVSGLDGIEYGRWSLPSREQMRQDILANNDGTRPREAWQRISQERMEAVLMRRCLASPHITVRRPWRVVDVREHGDEVTTTITSSGDGTEERIRSRYVVGADGAHSEVRRTLGVGLEGTPDVVGTSCQVHFVSTDRATLHRFGQFWHLFMARQIGRVSIVAQDEESTWTMQASVPPGVTIDHMDPVAFLRDRTASGLQVDRVLKHTFWRPQALVAEQYGTRRVFLAGDAAHQFIPTGGYGMNTGLGDAVDIGWKLAAVLRGWAGPGLLASYDAERRPVGRANRDRAVHNFQVHADAGQLVGADAGLLGADTPEGEALRAKLGAHYRDRRGENESFGVEMGYQYAHSPVIADADDEDEQGWVAAPDALRYRPTARPGARAPHLFLRDGTSVLDGTGTGFTLLDLAGRLDGSPPTTGVPLRVRRVSDPRVREVYRRDFVLLRPDGHVAWRSDHPPEDLDALLRVVTGWSTG